MIGLFGDYIIDEYIDGNVRRISPESPIPVFEKQAVSIVSGGAANVYENLKALGNQVKFYYDQNNISKKTRYVCGNHIMFRCDDEKFSPFDTIFMTEYNVKDCKYCILSDYNKGYLFHSKYLINYLKNKGIIVVVDPKKDLSYYYGADIIKLNKKEFDLYSNGNTIEEIHNLYKFETIIITDSGGSIIISSPEFKGEIYPDKHQVSDVTGAGDVFIASLVHFLNKGKSIVESCKKASKLASISVTKFGTYVLTQEDIAQTRTVFTNGCFDVLHRGHIEYLKASKKLGAKLIVGLNSDRSVRKLKGKNRPFNCEKDRQIVLQELDCVDEVILFDAETPYELIKAIKPDIITKGSDYKPEDVVGNDLTEVVIIPYVDGYSTTKILEKI